jgi:hypothetical protein
MKSNLFALTTALLITSCGHETKSSVINSAATELKLTEQTKFVGTTDNGVSCTVELRLNDNNEVTGAKLSGTYTVDYKIPAPLSGLYGVYNMPGEFDSATNIKSGDLKVGRGWLGGDLALEGSGKPIFWDTPDIHHKLTIKGSLTEPESVYYSSTMKIAGILPFVKIDLNCGSLSKAN